jgi:Xaa-Pro aminopeptidase
VDDRRPTTASHDAEITDELRASMREGWAARTPLITSPAGVAPYAAKRRELLSATFPGEAVVVRAGELIVRSNDTHYPYRPSSDFAWLVGWAEPEAVLVMHPTAAGHEPVLFLRERGDRSTDAFWRDRTYGELWTGPVPSHAEVSLHTGIEVRALADVPEVRNPDAFDRALAELRLIKDDWELDQLSAAVAATARGFDDVVARLTNAPSERWLEGTFFRRARLDGNDVGYGSIVGCGAHATCLHWTRNDGDVRAGDLALMDMGVEMPSLYTADVTRTVPISGTFSASQADVYDAVFDAQAAGIAQVKPGAAFTAPHDAAMRVLTERLVGWGLLKGSVDELIQTQLYRRYSLHGTSHMLGLDVHDCAQARHEHYRGGPLAAGMVMTVEPGLYFQVDDETVPPELRGIGVRIEDDVVVTPAGANVLSDGIPKQRAAVESWVRR